MSEKAMRFDETEIRPWQESIKRDCVSLFSAGLARTATNGIFDCSRITTQSVFTGYDVVDNEHFARTGEEVRSQAVRARRKYGLPRIIFSRQPGCAEEKSSNAHSAYAPTDSLLAIETTDKGQPTMDLGFSPSRDGLLRADSVA